LAAETAPENSAATPETFVVKLPVPATKLVALKLVVNPPTTPAKFVETETVPKL
jgi:hypothetical protein